MPKIIFDHLPKCGGNSVIKFLGDVAGRERIAPHVRATPALPIMNYFERYDIVAGHFSQQIFYNIHRDIRYITMLRDPVLRFLSFYYYQQTRPRETNFSTLLRSLRLEDYVRSGDRVALEILCNPMTRHFAISDGSVVSRHDELARAKRNLTRYAVVGLVEDMSGFVSDSCAVFGWSVPDREYHENRNADKSPRANIDGDTLQLIANYNRSDLELVAFASQLIAQRRTFGSGSAQDGGANADAWFHDSCPDEEGLTIDLERVNGRRSTEVVVSSGDPVEVEFVLRSAGIDEDNLIVAFRLRQYVSNLVHANFLDGLSIRNGCELRVCVRFPMLMNMGHYSVDVWVSGGDLPDRKLYSIARDFVKIDVRGHQTGWFAGAVNLPLEWSHR